MDSLERIHGLARFGSRLGLSRMERLMELLGNPQDSLPVIHVAGTNGKGSVSRYLYQVCQTAGLRAGLYTSPFLQRFSERIEFDGAEISDSDLDECTERVFKAMEQMLSEGLDSPTEFEAVTAIAFLHFSRKQPDVVILEVGLGGSGDSTNVVKQPLACVITSISYDHMQQLGDTLPEIASEKAGIIKPGVPVISNVKDQSAAAVVAAAAKEKACPLWELGWRGRTEDTVNTAAAVNTAVASGIRECLEGSRFDAKVYLGTSMIEYPALEISMLGRHQVENALCAVTVLEVLRQKGCLDVPTESIYAGMKKARQPGRLEILHREPWLLIDGAHNVDGVRALREALEIYFPNRRILLIIGMLADKETEKMTREFLQISDLIAATEPENPRKLPGDQLRDIIEDCGGTCVATLESGQVCEYIEKHGQEYEVTVVGGSLYLIGSVREYFIVKAGDGGNCNETE